MHKAVEAACIALKDMTEIKGIGVGVATRLLALARPDVAVSVNGGSALRLKELTGCKVPIGSQADPDAYHELLQWVARQPWHASPRPSDPWQAALWSKRAALIDCFVYEPV